MTAEEDRIKDDLIEKIMEQLEIITRNMKGRDEEL